MTDKTIIHSNNSAKLSSIKYRLPRRGWGVRTRAGVGFGGFGGRLLLGRVLVGRFINQGYSGIEILKCSRKTSSKS